MTSSSESRERLPIVVAGHVDHGKSTVVGRLLADTGSLPQGKLEQIRAYCERNAKPFEYAFLLDALKDEQSQGITIDAARIFFRTAKREYLIIDAPGHVEFLKNMVSGAAHAEAALLVIDAKEGVRENSRRHGYLLSLLGLKQVAVLVNKMDLVDYSEQVFRAVEHEYTAFLASVGVQATCFIPLAAFHGENLARKSDKLSWHEGPTVLEALDSFKAEAASPSKPFRMPVQDVYKFTKAGDERRIVAGTIEAGALNAGDRVTFYPSGKSSSVKTLEGFPEAPASPVGAGRATGFTLVDQIYVRRGEIAALAGQPAPQVSSRFRASVFWLGARSLSTEREYILKLGTARARARVESVVRSLDASTLAVRPNADQVQRNEAAECVFAIEHPIAFDLAEQNATLGRFVLVDDFEISGGGLVRETLPDAAADVRRKVLQRKAKWQPGSVAAAERAGRFGHRAAVLLVTGANDELRKAAARALERSLFAERRLVYYLGIGSVLYGVDADIRGESKHEEDIRRLAEVANILLDAGMIIVLTASELTKRDQDLLKLALEEDRVTSVWIGERMTTDFEADVVAADDDAEIAAGRVRARLEEYGRLRP